MPALLLPGGQLVECGRFGHCWRAAALAHGAVQVAPLGEACGEAVAVAAAEQVDDGGHDTTARPIGLAHDGQ